MLENPHCMLFFTTNHAIILLMKSEERHQAIISMIPFNGYVMVKDLSETFNVTEETIRRDLVKICETNNSIKKIHGGVFRTADDDLGAPQNFRQTLLTKEKTRFAEVCAAIPSEGDCIMLDSSTTCHFIAQQLKLKNQKFQIVTNSLRTASLFSDNEYIQVVLVGGRLRKSNGSLVGPEASRQLEKICADYSFISPTGVDVQFGITDTNSNEAVVREMMIRNSKKRILVADHTKFGLTFPNIIAPLDIFDSIVTDKATSAEFIDEIRSSKLNVVYC